MSVVNGVVLEITMDSIIKKVHQASELFNKIVDGGRGVDELFCDELIVRLNQQHGVTKEEVDETLKAIVDGNIVEYYDGLVDVIFTMTFLYSIIYHLDNKYDFDLYYLSNGVEHIELSQKIKELLKRDDINLGVLDKCADLIIENNEQKFTTDKNLFDTWDSKFNRKSVEIEGVVYYYLVDDNNKVKKHDNFKGVDLSVVLSGVFGVLLNNVKG